MPDYSFDVIYVLNFQSVFFLFGLRFFLIRIDCFFFMTSVKYDYTYLCREIKLFHFIDVFRILKIIYGNVFDRHLFLTDE